jgi:hypothetical protein
MKARQIFWTSLCPGEGSQAFVSSAMVELAALLERAPMGLRLEVRELPDPIRPRVTPLLIKPPGSGKSRQERATGLHLLAAGVLEALTDYALAQGLTAAARLLIHCPFDSELAKQMRFVSPTACWGLAVDQTYAAVYPPHESKYVLFHEALHLLGAEDCYDSQTLSQTCTTPNCIMNHNPDVASACAWPFLCPDNIKRITGSVASDGSSGATRHT